MIKNILLIIVQDQIILKILKILYELRQNIK